VAKEYNRNLDTLISR